MLEAKGALNLIFKPSTDDDAALKVDRKKRDIDPDKNDALLLNRKRNICLRWTARVLYEISNKHRQKSHYRN
jgi:hypothetical protein